MTPAEQAGVRAALEEAVETHLASRASAARVGVTYEIVEAEGAVVVNGVLPQPL